MELDARGEFENNFELLPDEILLEQCKYLDSKSLIGFSRAYKRVFEVCGGIIEERKIISKIKGILLDGKKVLFIGRDNGDESWDDFMMTLDNNDMIQIKQFHQMDLFTLKYRWPFDDDVRNGTEKELYGKTKFPTKYEGLIGVTYGSVSVDKLSYVIDTLKRKGFSEVDYEDYEEDDDLDRLWGQDRSIRILMDQW